MARNIPIKVARAEKDMTQKELAEAVGVSRQTINAIEQGEYNPSAGYWGSVLTICSGRKNEKEAVRAQ